MSEIFDEKNMKERLETCIPEGEALLAGIHCVNKELHVFRYYQNCVPHEDKLYKLEDVEPRILQVAKSKYSVDDLYIGITQNYFVFKTCLERKYLYEFDYVKEDVTQELESIEEAVCLRDIGHCFRLSDIVKCEFKKQLFGAILCELEFKDKSTFKLLLPKKAGLGKGMPNHAEYKEKIIDCLGRKNK